MADYMPPDPPACVVIVQQQAQPVRNLVRRIVCDGDTCRVVMVEADAPPLPMAGPTIVYSVADAEVTARRQLFPRVRAVLGRAFPRIFGR